MHDDTHQRLQDLRLLIITPSEQEGPGVYEAKAKACYRELEILLRQGREVAGDLLGDVAGVRAVMSDIPLRESHDAHAITTRLGEIFAELSEVEAKLEAARRAAYSIAEYGDIPF